MIMTFLMRLFLLVSICLSLFYDTSSIAQTNQKLKNTDHKFVSAFNFIKNAYVDSVDEAHIVEEAIVKMLDELDPHSIYYTQKQIKSANEPLKGNFEGIGIEFFMYKDTLTVIRIIQNGPAERAGLIPGDKILSVDDEKITGSHITTTFIASKLKREKGTKLKLMVKRLGEKKPIRIPIVCNKVPINSIQTFFLIDQQTAYVKLIRFSKNSQDEFNSAISSLRKDSVTNLIFDLRGNTGGYLKTAIKLADEFLSSDKLIVFTKGSKRAHKKYFSTSKGNFKDGKVIILMNHTSASASEILAGAIQDWDRGLILGKRSFGKGLVQQQFNLPDESAIRLTTSRYYTPSGRCIQKSYDDGNDAYRHELSTRFSKGELVYADSIDIPDSLKYYTNNKRIVYGGGGIIPDIFIPYDSTQSTNYFKRINNSKAIVLFAIQYTMNNRDSLLKTYPKKGDFISSFSVNNELFNQFRTTFQFDTLITKIAHIELLQTYFEQYIQMNKDSINTANSVEDLLVNVSFLNQFKEDFLVYVNNYHNDQNNEIELTYELIKTMLTAEIGNYLFDKKTYYQILAKEDNDITTALEILKSKQFDSLNTSN